MAFTPLDSLDSLNASSPSLGVSAADKRGARERTERVS
jgi:hypothetical protein